MNSQVNTLRKFSVVFFVIVVVFPFLRYFLLQSWENDLSLTSPGSDNINILYGYKIILFYFLIFFILNILISIILFITTKKSAVIKSRSFLIFLLLSSFANLFFLTSSYLVLLFLVYSAVYALPLILFLPVYNFWLSRKIMKFDEKYSYIVSIVFFIIFLITGWFIIYLDTMFS